MGRSRSRQRPNFQPQKVTDVEQDLGSIATAAPTLGLGATNSQLAAQPLQKMLRFKTIQGRAPGDQPATPEPRKSQSSSEVTEK